MVFFIRYTRKNGTTGGYCGENREAFITELNRCERFGYKYSASFKGKISELTGVNRVEKIPA